MTKVGDKSFITRCTKTLDDTPAFKAYSADICGCVQDKLKDQGLGDKDADSKAIENKGVATIPECAREVAGTQ